MQFYSRAGLVALTLLTFIVSLASSSPIPHNSLRLRFNEPASSAISLSKPSFDARIVAPQDRALIGPKYSAHVLASSINPQDPESVVSRRGFFSKIRNAFRKVGNGIKNVAQKAGGAFKGAAQKVGNGAKSVANKVGNGVKAVTNKVGNGVKSVANKVGNGVKTGINKVGNGVKTAATYMKQNGAMIGKFGLKVLSTATSVAAKAAGFIPGVGKIASKALKAASMGANIASNAINAELPGSLSKGMDIMDKIRNPLSGAAGAALDAVLRREEDLTERDMVDWSDFESREIDMREYELEERDYDELEEREFIDVLYTRDWDEWEDWE